MHGRDQRCRARNQLLCASSYHRSTSKSSSASPDSGCPSQSGKYNNVTACLPGDVDFYECVLPPPLPLTSRRRVPKLMRPHLQCAQGAPSSSTRSWTSLLAFSPDFRSRCSLSASTPTGTSPSPRPRLCVRLRDCQADLRRRARRYRAFIPSPTSSLAPRPLPPPRPDLAASAQRTTTRRVIQPSTMHAPRPAARTTR